MARVEVDEVKQIIETSLSDPIITAFIDSANVTVTALLGTSTVLSTDQMKEIEKWMAAHLIACTRERQVKSESVDGASVTYEGSTGDGLDSTMYGQMAKMLDTSGVLASSIGMKTITIKAITSFED